MRERLDCSVVVLICLFCRALLLHVFSLRYTCFIYIYFLCYCLLLCCCFVCSIYWKFTWIYVLSTWFAFCVWMLPASATHMHICDLMTKNRYVDTTIHIHKQSRIARMQYYRWMSPFEYEPHSVEFYFGKFGCKVSTGHACIFMSCSLVLPQLCVCWQCLR